MKCDVLKLRAARDRRALTQEKLAAEAKIDIRTVQRAEAGAALRQDTIADIAAVLGIPLSGLIILSEEDAGEPVGESVGAGMTLKRTSKGREPIELLENSRLAKLECDVDPTPDLMELLTDSVTFIEGMLPQPWNEAGQSGPLTFNSLVDRLQHIARMNGILEKLERHGLALFVGSTWLAAIMPCWREEGLCVYTGQNPEIVRATRLVIASHLSDRVTVEADTKWPVEIAKDDLDADVPF